MNIEANTDSILRRQNEILAKINELKKVTQREVLPFSTQNNRYNENIIKFIENSIL